MLSLKPIIGSSQVDAAAYDAAQRVLAVKFKNGPFTYLYQNVPPETAEAFDKAESKGKFIGSQIKGKFEFTKVNGSAEEATET